MMIITRNVATVAVSIVQKLMIGTPVTYIRHSKMTFLLLKLLSIESITDVLMRFIVIIM